MGDVEVSTLPRGSVWEHASPELFTEAANRAVTYLESVSARKVTPSTRALANLEELAGPMPDQSCSPQAVLELLDRVAAPGTVATAGGRFFGYVIGSAVPASVVASWQASAWDQNTGLRAMSPAAVKLEDVALGWVRDLLNLPEGCGGAVVTGATMANFAGLSAARHALLERAGWDVENDGLFAAPLLKVVVSEEAHASLIKALGLLGLGRRRVYRVPVDGRGRMRADALPALDDRTLVCIQAGNVNTGDFDPASEICSLAREKNAWVHVDGAFGLWASVSERFKDLTSGFCLADSWATDGHKWPNVGYDCGIALVREPRFLLAAQSVSAAYLSPGVEREPSHYSPELSRRARGIELWASLRSMGRKGLSSLIERTCDYAMRFADGLRSAGYEVLNEVVINQVLVSFGSVEQTLAVIQQIQTEGCCWCGGTEWQGHTAMRISVSSWATTAEDVEISLEAILRAAGRVCTRLKNPELK